jgi:hypothetical protein
MLCLQLYVDRPSTLQVQDGANPAQTVVYVCLDNYGEMWPYTAIDRATLEGPRAGVMLLQSHENSGDLYTCIRRNTVYRLPVTL